MKKAVLVLLAAILLAQSVAVLAEKQVFAYQGNVAFFEENGLMGLRDKAGNVLHPAEFVSAKPFDVNNLAHVYLADGRQGFIDRTGSYAVKPMQVYHLGYIELIAGPILFDKIVYRLGDALNNRVGLISLSGEILLPAEYVSIVPFSKEKNFIKPYSKYYLVDNQGKQLLDQALDYFDVDFFGIVENENETRCYHPNGVCIYQKTPKGIHYTDEKGNAIEVSAWEELHIGQEYKQGYIIGVKGHWRGIMDVKGNTVIAPEWSDVSLRNANYFTMEDLHGNTFSYNIKSKKIKKLNLENGSKLEVFEDNCILYVNEENNYWGYMDYEGNILSKISGEYVIWSGEKQMAEGLILTHKDNQPYYFDAHGNSMTSKEWEQAFDFSAGYAQVQIKGKWGFINTKGEVVIEPAWDYASSFYADYGPAAARVEKDGQSYGFINTKGEVLCLYKD